MSDLTTLIENTLDEDFWKILKKLETVADRHAKTTLSPKQVQVLVKSLHEIGDLLDDPEAYQAHYHNVRGLWDEPTTEEEE